MNMQKFTQKSLDAINSAQSTAIEYQNQSVEQEHILYALLEQESGLIPQLFTKMGVDASSVTGEVKKLVAALPRVTGSGREANTVYITQDVDKTLNKAEGWLENLKSSFSLRADYY